MTEEIKDPLLDLISAQQEWESIDWTKRWGVAHDKLRNGYERRSVSASILGAEWYARGREHNAPVKPHQTSDRFSSYYGEHAALVILGVLDSRHGPCAAYEAWLRGEEISIPVDGTEANPAHCIWCKRETERQWQGGKTVCRACHG